jgi:hypothetical protein
VNEAHIRSPAAEHAGGETLPAFRLSKNTFPRLGRQQIIEGKPSMIE